MRTEFSSGTLGHRTNASDLICFTFLIVVCPDHSFLLPLSMEQKSLVKWPLCWVGKCMRLTLTWWEGNFFQDECELGWPFHTELGMGNLLPFHQLPCPLLRTKKGRFRPWAATLTSLHQPQCPASEYRESNTNMSSPALAKEQEQILEGIILKAQSSSAWKVRGGGLGNKEVPIILPGCTESPENDHIRDCQLF